MFANKNVMDFRKKYTNEKQSSWHRYRVYNKYSVTYFFQNPLCGAHSRLWKESPREMDAV